MKNLASDLVRVFFVSLICLAGTMVFSLPMHLNSMADDLNFVEDDSSMTIISKLAVADWLISHEGPRIRKYLRHVRAELADRLKSCPEEFQSMKISPLTGATHLHRRDIMRYMIEEGESVNPTKEESYITPLFLSLSRDFWSGFSMLLEHGADPTVLAPDGESMIYRLLLRTAWFLERYKDQTCKKCKQLKRRAREYHLHIMQLLLDNGVDPNTTGEYEESPLVVAAHNNLIPEAELLIRNGAYLDFEDMLNTTPLIAALENQHLEMAEMLLQYGADPDRKNSAGLAPIFVALKTKNIELVEMMVEYGADLTVKSPPILDCKGLSVLAAAVWYHGGTEMINLLLDSGIPAQREDEEFDAIQLCINCFKEEAIPLLLAHGATMKKTYSFDRRTLLHIAAFVQNLDAIAILVNYGMDINVRNKQGMTPLHYAAIYQKETSVNCLIQFGANPWLKDNKGRTALDIAKGDKNRAIILMLQVAMNKWHGGK